MSDDPRSTKQKFFGSRGLELTGASQALAQLLPLELGGAAYALTGPDTCAPDDPDVAFHMTGAAWGAFQTRLATFQEAFAAYYEDHSELLSALAVLQREMERIKFWPEH